MKRIHSNKNLQIHQERTYEGFDIQSQRGSLVKNYLDRTFACIENALNKYSRVSMMRFDLHLPDNTPPSITLDNNIITRFFSSLKEKIENSQASSRRNGARVHESDIDYIWCREVSKTGKVHYHVAIFLNGYSYKFIGKFILTGGNMYARIHEAWGSALYTFPEDLQGLIHIPENPSYEIIRGNEETIREAFHRISYLCKIDTKEFGNQHHCFGFSRV